MPENTGLVFKMYTDLTNYSQGLKRAGNELNQFNNSMKKIGGMIAGAFSVAAIVQFGKEAVDLASKAEAVEAAFKRIGGTNYLKGLQDATRGTVTDIELMKRAVAANNFKIPLDQLANLFTFARRRAEETGQSVDYLVDSIVTGIGRKSPLILDNLGISAVALKQKLNGVSTDAASIGDVAKAVGTIATEELAKMGAESENTAQKIAQISTQWANMKADIGKAIIESKSFSVVFAGIKDIFDQIKAYGSNTTAEGIILMGTSQINTLDQANAALENIVQTRADLAISNDTWLDGLLNPSKANAAQNLIDQLDPLYYEIMRIRDAIQNNPVTNYWNNIAKQINDAKAAADASKAAADAAKKERDAYLEANSILGKLNTQIAANEKIIKLATNERTIAYYRNVNDQLKMQLDYYEKLGTSMQKIAQKGLPKSIKNDVTYTPQYRTGAQVNTNYGNDAPSLFELQQNADAASDILNSFREDILSTAAEGFGLLLSGDMGLSGFFKNILMVTADFAKQFGQLLITIGLAKVSLDKIGISGVGAVIAGMALVTASTVLKSLLAKGPSMPALATGTNYIPSNGPYYLHKGEAVVPKRYNINGASTIPQMVTVYGKISGRDIIISSTRENYYRSRTA